MKILISVAMLIVLGVSGCGTVPLIDKHQEQLSQLRPGYTTNEESNRLMPSARLAGQNMVSGKAVDAYSVKDRIYDISVDRFVDDELWFYFHDGRLVKWGRPQDWPAESDFIVEVRN